MERTLTYININKFTGNTRRVLVEKINHSLDDRTLYEILQSDYGFDVYVISEPINFFNRFKKRLGLHYKERLSTSGNWLTSNINGHCYEVYFDMWYVDLYKNRELIFSDRRFDNKDFFEFLEK